MKTCVVHAAQEDIPVIRRALTDLGFEVSFIEREFSGEVPLKGVVAPEAIAPPVRDYLITNGINSARDLGRLDLNALASAPGVARDSLTKFVRALSRSERYPDADALQDFLVRRGIFI